jgi:hypothetical protein
MMPTPARRRRTVSRARLAAAALTLVAAPAVHAAPSPPPTVTVRDVTVVKHPPGTQQAVFSVCLLTEPAGEVSVGVATFDISARAGRHYRPKSGRLTWHTAGNRCQNVSVRLGATDRPALRLGLRLSEPVGLRVARRSAVATVRSPGAGARRAAAGPDEVTVTAGPFTLGYLRSIGLPNDVRCPNDHPYLVDRNYTTYGSTLQAGIEIWEDVAGNPIAAHLVQLLTDDELNATGLQGNPTGDARFNVMTNWWAIPSANLYIRIHCQTTPGYTILA